MDCKAQLEKYVNGDKAVLERYPWLMAVKWGFDKVGMPTMLVAFGLGVWTGWIPSPLLDMAQALNQHVEQTGDLIEILKAALKLP